MGLEAALFDLDGVIVSTDDLHFRSWERMAREEGIPFDRQVNERLRGVSRMESLAIVLERASCEYDEAARLELAERKNRYYQVMIRELTGRDLLPGARRLILELRDHGVRTAVCSGSRNARRLVQLLDLEPLFQAVVDGNDIQRTKPDPQVFLMGARRLEAPPERCLVLEDAAVGIEAAHRAGMKALGVGDPERLCEADRVVPDLAGITYQELEALFR